MDKVRPSNSVRVLLVEDSLLVRQRICSLIEETCPADIVGEASSAGQALELFQLHRPEAVVLDLQLENSVGYGVIQEVKKRNPGCTVIVITSFATVECRTLCEGLGADYFFDKSFEFESITDVLTQLYHSGSRNQPPS